MVKTYRSETLLNKTFVVILAVHLLYCVQQHSRLLLLSVINEKYMPT
jgi:hypothetical protein